MPPATSRLSHVAAGVLLIVLAASAALADGDAIAIVNGSPISKQKLTDILIESHGLEVLQQLVLLDLAKQETKRRALKISPGDVDREYSDTVDRIAAQAGLNGAAATPENKQKALEAMLDNKRISMAEFRLSMERNAHLRRLIEVDLEITDATLKAEFSRVYGEKRVARHIQLSARDSDAINEALNLLKAGVDFAEVARRLSKHDDRAQGGQMPPFAFDDQNIPAAMREAAFTMNPGDVSTPLIVDQNVQIMKLEQTIAPANVKFEDVRDEIARNIRERVINQEMQKRVSELFDKAKVSVLDKGLKERYDLFLKNRAATGTQTP